MRIRACMILAVLSCGFCGCTAGQLRVSTVRQAKTLTETQYEQVLNNLAMFYMDPNALPSLVSLKSGSTQIGDTGQLGFLGVAGLDTKFGSSPTVAGSRSIVDQWGTAPVTDDNVLKVLRMAYQNATGRPRFLSEHEANDIGHDLSQQIGTNADISSDPEMLRTLASILAPRATQAYFDALTQRSDWAAMPQVQQQEQIQTNISHFAANTLKTLNDKITNTLDEDFLAQKDMSNPCLGFVVAETEDDPRLGDITTGLAPVVRDRVNAIQSELSEVPAPTEKKVNEWRAELGRIAPGLEIPSGSYAIRRRPKVPTGLARETARRINDVQEELCKIATRLPPGWFQVGCKKDVPKDACYVGHYKSCGRECYVWVGPNGLQALADFTLSVLKLSTTFQETQIVTVPSGIQYSPAFSTPFRGR